MENFVTDPVTHKKLKDTSSDIIIEELTNALTSNSKFLLENKRFGATWETFATEVFAQFFF
ncbi:hypothetical protein LCGC14_2923020 [marine sediment metagenome]|uniref:Uncharacterized protein n=1 Tax=marine sediment metagenome TaxID=412755 RepID=A0A0F8YA33_9ZZZZ